eukprot:XP_019920761.1 PREDICTED: von Willebrand factor A domain-containing protein 2 [Crassostrea gigas]
MSFIRVSEYAALLLFILYLQCHHTKGEKYYIEKTGQTWKYASDSCMLMGSKWAPSYVVNVQESYPADIADSPHWIGATAEITPWFKFSGCYVYEAIPEEEIKKLDTPSVFIGPVADCYLQCKSHFGVNVNVNECVEYPGLCKNGGTCENLCGDYRCHCTEGNQGTHCDGDIDECKEYKPCKNGGNCTNTKGSFFCTCNSNYTGALCNEDVDECYQNPSRCNNGECQNFYGGFLCSCHTGFTGALCNTDLDECDLKPCSNNGSCVNTLGSFHCNCVDSWDGPLCEHDLCNTKATKLVFAVDTSFSSTGEIFHKQLQYITDVVSRITISDVKFKVAVISFGSTAKVAIDFDSYTNNTELLDQVNKMPFMNGTTNIPAACSEIKKIIELTSWRSQFVFLFTDGMPNSLSDAVNSVNNLRAYLEISSDQNEVYLITFGNDVRHEGFHQLSKNSRHSDVFPSTNLEPLYNVFQKRVNVTCAACEIRRDVDLVLVLDTSSIQHPTTYLASRNIFLQLLAAMNEFVFLGQGYVQIGVVHYSDNATVFMPLNFTHDLNTFASTFQASLQDNFNSSSNLSNALQFIQKEMFTTKHGARDHASKYVVHVFNGHDTNITESIGIVEDMTKRGINILSIGIGTKYQDSDVLKTATSPFHAYFSELDFSTNQWNLTNTELEFVKKFNSRLECTSRINA